MLWSIHGPLPYLGAESIESLLRELGVMVDGSESLTVVEFADAALGMVARASVDGSLSKKSAETYVRTLIDFTGWVQLMGGKDLRDVAALAPDWVVSRDLDRRGLPAEAALATQHRRKAAVDWFFRAARLAGLTGADPCKDLTLPPRQDPAPVLLTEAQVARLDVAAVNWPSTRLPGVYAACISGVSGTAVGAVTGSALDHVHHTIAVEGLTLSVLPRHWALIERHALAHAAGCLPGMDPGPLFYTGTAGPESQQAQVGTRIKMLGDSASVQGLTVSRLNDWSARRAFEDGGRDIAAAAAILRVGSLDTAARRIGWRWKP